MAKAAGAAILSALLASPASGVPVAPTVRLSNGVEMPLIAAGTWQYDNDTAATSVTNALKVGFRLIDTAFNYRNQVGVGRGVRASGVPRNEVFLETKVPGCGLDKAISAMKCYEDTKTVLEEDLQLLQMDYVDLVILHTPPVVATLQGNCNLACTQIRDQWRALEEFYAAKKAKAIGVSNYCPSCFACLDGFAKVVPMVNQVSYHIGMGKDAGGVRSDAAKRGVVVQAYSPLGDNHDEEILSGSFTTGLAKAHNRSTVQVALKYLVQSGVPAITKSTSADHLAEDLDLWSFNLTAAEMEAADKYSHPGSPSFICTSAAEEVVV